MNSPDWLLSGYNIGGVPILNEGTVQKCFSEDQEIFPDMEPWKSYTLEDYKNLMINNELVHWILFKELGFSDSAEYGWSKVESEIEWYQIQSSREVNEFLSDAGAIMTSGAETLRIFNNVLATCSHSKDGITPKEGNTPFEFQRNQGYFYSNAIMYTEIKKILEAKWTSLFDIMEANDWQIVDIKKEVLKYLDGDAIETIQEAYRKQGQYLIQTIRKFKGTSLQKG